MAPFLRKNAPNAFVNVMMSTSPIAQSSVAMRGLITGSMFFCFVEKCDAEDDADDAEYFEVREWFVEDGDAEDGDEDVACGEYWVEE